MHELWIDGSFPSYRTLVCLLSNGDLTICAPVRLTLRGREWAQMDENTR